ncbi:hypothetical protein ACSS6N_07455 [Peribacillus frigoritolerans]
MNTFLYRKKPYWIEEICHTPAEVLAMLRHERQSAERERISGINWYVY